MVSFHLFALKLYNAGFLPANVAGWPYWSTPDGITRRRNRTHTERFNIPSVLSAKHWIWNQSRFSSDIHEIFCMHRTALHAKLRGLVLKVSYLLVCFSTMFRNLYGLWLRSWCSL